MGKYYLTIKLTDSMITDLNDIVGEIEFKNTSNGKIYEDLIKTGNFNIVPYGFGEKDENGEITSFKLTGFSISEKK